MTAHTKKKSFTQHSHKLTRPMLRYLASKKRVLSRVEKIADERRSFKDMNVNSFYNAYRVFVWLFKIAVKPAPPFCLTEYICELVKPNSRIEKPFCFPEVLRWQHISCHATLDSIGLLYHGCFPAKLFSFWLGDFPELKVSLPVFPPTGCRASAWGKKKIGMQNVWLTLCVGTDRDNRAQSFVYYGRRRCTHQSKRGKGTAMRWIFYLTSYCLIDPVQLHPWFKQRAGKLAISLPAALSGNTCGRGRRITARNERW